MTDDDVAATFARLPGLVNSDPAVVGRGRHLRTNFLIGCGGRRIHVTIEDGRVAAVGEPALMGSSQFAIHAGAKCWERFWRAVPEPGYHDLLAMTRFGHARIEGDMLPLMQNLQYIKDVLASPRCEVEEVAHGD